MLKISVFLGDRDSYTRMGSKDNSKGKTQITQSLIEHFATNCPQFIHVVHVIKLCMTGHYLIYGIRKIGAKHLVRIIPRIIEMSVFEDVR